MSGQSIRPWKRVQHTGFGREIRGLLGSKVKRDKEVAGIVASELDELCKRRASSQRHPQEDRLTGALAEVGYLRLYGDGFSVRPYFTVINGVIFMLALDPSKRQTQLSVGMKTKLVARLRDAKNSTQQ